MLWVFAPVAIALLLVVVPRSDDGIRSKGEPSVAVFVRRAQQVTRWDGRSPLRAEDAVQLEVAPAGFRALTIVQGASVLYAAPIEAGRPLLVPRSWTLDAAPGPEQVTIALSQRPLSSTEIEQLEHAARSASLWTMTLELPKEPAR